MKHLNDYIYEELQINEVFYLLTTLCGACALHFTVKGLKKIRNCATGFWDWATGEKDLNLSMGASESDDSTEEPIVEAKKFDKTKVQPMMVPDEKVLDKVMEILKTDSKKNRGFYVFDKLFKETPELKKINKAPYFANYVVFMDAGSQDNEEQRPNFYGMLAFSVKYWQVVAKKGKDAKIKDAAQNLIRYMNIFAVQTDKKFAKQGLFDVYLENMKKAVKEAKMEGLTIKYESDELVEVFKKYGFEKVEGLDGYMKLSLIKNEE